MYLEEEQVKWLVLTLRDRFPGAELVFDAFSPLHVWGNTLLFSIKKLGAPLHWGIWRGQEVEGWADGIRLLDEWFPFTRPEPRLGRARLVRHIPLLAKTTGVFHYRLGKTAR